MPTCDNKVLFWKILAEERKWSSFWRKNIWTKIKDNKEHVRKEALTTTNVNGYFGQVFLQREVSVVTFIKIKFSAYSLFYKIEVWKIKNKINVTSGSRIYPGVPWIFVKVLWRRQLRVNKQANAQTPKWEDKSRSTFFESVRLKDALSSFSGKILLNFLKHVTFWTHIFKTIWYHFHLSF